MCWNRDVSELHFTDHKTKPQSLLPLTPAPAAPLEPLWVRVGIYKVSWGLSLGMKSESTQGREGGGDAPALPSQPPGAGLGQSRVLSAPQNPCCPRASALTFAQAPTCCPLQPRATPAPATRWGCTLPGLDPHLGISILRAPQTGQSYPQKQGSTENPPSTGLVCKCGSPNAADVAPMGAGTTSDIAAFQG